MSSKKPLDKKPFLVRVEIEIAIFAENEESARRSRDIQDAVRDALYENNIFWVEPLDRIPDGWELDYLCYGTDHDVTLKEALEMVKNPKKEPSEDKETLPLPYDKSKDDVKN